MLTLLTVTVCDHGLQDKTIITTKSGNEFPK